MNDKSKEVVAKEVVAKEKAAIDAMRKPNKNKTPLTAVMTLAMLAGMSGISRPAAKEKTCLNCGAAYTHKKKFCSAACCKLYRSTKND